MVSVIQGGDYQGSWESACNKLCEGGGLDPRTLPGARRAQLRFQRLSAQVLAFVHEVGEAVAHPEDALISRDGALTGTPDLVLVRPHDAVVLDYKTGLVVEEGVPNASYERQIRLYAGLVSERHERPVSRGVLFSSRQGAVDVDVSPAAVAATMAEARAAWAAYNDRVPGPQPAHPEPGVCRWCPYQARCDAFWDVVDDTWIPEVGESLMVQVQEPPEIAANGLGALLTIVESGTGEKRASLLLAEVPTALLGQVSQGDVLAVVGLRRIAGRPDQVYWSERSSLERVTRRP